MPPVKIKYYGVVWLTRSQYLWATAVAAAVVVVLCVVLAVVAGDRLPPVRWPWDPVPANAAPGVVGFLYHHLYTIIVLLLVAEAIDIAVTLHKFRTREADARDAAEDDE